MTKLKRYTGERYFFNKFMVVMVIVSLVVLALMYGCEGPARDPIAEAADTLVLTLIDETVIIRAGMAETVVWQMDDGGVKIIERHGNEVEVQTILWGKGKP